MCSRCSRRRISAPWKARVQAVPLISQYGIRNRLKNPNHFQPPWVPVYKCVLSSLTSHPLSRSLAHSILPQLIQPRLKLVHLPSPSTSACQRPALPSHRDGRSLGWFGEGRRRQGGGGLAELRARVRVGCSRGRERERERGAGRVPKRSATERGWNVTCKRDTAHLLPNADANFGQDLF